MAGDAEVYKKQAAERAVELVEPGMVVGMGHGSTAIFAVRRIAELLRDGQLADILGVPCSRHVEAEAERLGIPLTTLEGNPAVDLTIDGADEVSGGFALIKGGGGALLREKVVAQASRREIIVVDESKVSPALGTNCAVPVEVTPFGWRPEKEHLTMLGADAVLRVDEDGHPFETDHGNLILDADFGSIRNPAALAVSLDARAGIVCHGIFVGLATDILIAGPSGLRHLRAETVEWPEE
jgi:ribose 5-phosphate isomerase A